MVFIHILCLIISSFYFSKFSPSNVVVERGHFTDGRSESMSLPCFLLDAWSWTIMTITTHTLLGYSGSHENLLVQRDVKMWKASIQSSSHDTCHIPTPYQHTDSLQRKCPQADSWSLELFLASFKLIKRIKRWRGLRMCEGILFSSSSLTTEV